MAQATRQNEADCAISHPIFPKAESYNTLL